MEFFLSVCLRLLVLAFLVHSFLKMINIDLISLTQKLVLSKFPDFYVRCVMTKFRIINYITERLPFEKDYDDDQIPWYVPPHLRHYGTYDSLWLEIYCFFMITLNFEAIYKWLYDRHPSYNWGRKWYMEGREVSYQRFHSSEFQDNLVKEFVHGLETEE